MSLIRLILNLLWFFTGGVITGLTWLFGGLLLLLTVVGAPWAFSAWRIASYSFWPFGREIVWREPDASVLGKGCLGVGGNIIWLVLAGWYIAIGHVLASIPQFISIIGIPFGIKNLELAKLSLAPIGRTIRNRD
ncbi:MULTISPECIES: YccF domain-containing protein [unclassified Brevundimonas]|uniref:YccF domain-containing protein n=1 Tax=unclassified Brevundimonas TaxID=2622653 RepID=UPI0025C6A963|nr:MULTISPECIES: YccF domain-containing protein [unclassified Brevundimonas]